MRKLIIILVPLFLFGCSKDNKWDKPAKKPKKVKKAKKPKPPPKPKTIYKTVQPKIVYRYPPVDMQPLLGRFRLVHWSNIFCNNKKKKTCIDVGSKRGCMHKYVGTFTLTADPRKSKRGKIAWDFYKILDCGNGNIVGKHRRNYQHFTIIRIGSAAYLAQENINKYEVFVQKRSITKYPGGGGHKGKVVRLFERYVLTYRSLDEKNCTGLLRRAFKCRKGSRIEVTYIETIELERIK